MSSAIWPQHTKPAFLPSTHFRKLSTPTPHCLSHLRCFNSGTIPGIFSNLSKSYSSFTGEDVWDGDRLEGDSRIPDGKFTTCWGQISPPLPSQAIKLNILKAPAIGAHGTPGSQRALCPLEKKPPTHIPKFRVPALETPWTYTLTLDPASFSPRSSLLPAVIRCPPPLCNRGRAARGLGEGCARARAAPAQTMPERRSARPAGPILLPPTLTLSLVSC